MRLIQRIILVLFVLLSFGGVARAQSCVFATAGPDQTICTGQCANLIANVSGTRQTSFYATNPIPYSPYAFTGGNPVLVNLDDLWSQVVNIPFCFDFYGATYNQLVIGTNGVLSFDVAQANGTCAWSINASIPNSTLPLNSIMAPFHDIDPTYPTTTGATTINWQVYGTAPCRSFVVNWYDVGMYGNGCDTLTSSSQVVLHESTNIINIFILNKSFCLAWNNGAGIEGIQDATGAAATAYPGRNYPTTWSATNDGVEFRPSGQPNYSITWTDPSNTVVGTTTPLLLCPAQTTTYILHVVNNNCTGNPLLLSDTVTINVTPSTLAVSDTFNYPDCGNACNGDIGILATNGVPPYSYSWIPNVSNGPTATNLCGGLYACEVTDGTGCSVTVNINLAPPPPFTLSAVVTPTLCNDSTGTATLTIVGGTGPFSVIWTTGDTTLAIDTLPAGAYQVNVIDSAGCPDSLMAIITQNGLQLAIQSTPLLCNGDCNATAAVNVLNGIPPFAYTWIPYGGNNANASSLCSGTFVCNVTDSTGCNSSISIPISSPMPVSVTPTANQTICFGQSTTIGATVTGGTPPYSYSWNNSLPPVSTHTITPTQTTIYSVIVTDANGCVSTQQTTLVKVNHAPIPGFTASLGDCPPSVIQFTNTTDTAVSYMWNFGDPSSGANNTSTLTDPTHIYNTGGNYTVTLWATNAYGCTDSIILPNAVHILEGPVAGASANTSFLTSLDPVMLLNNTSIHSSTYLIFFGDGDSLLTTSPGPYEHSYDTLGVFTVTLYAWSIDGCPDTTWLTITIEDPTTLFIPNAFTPNGDGTNDYFMPLGINVRKMHLLIFDRWGLLIFESSDMNNGWDGTYKGDRVQEDVYVWKLSYEDNFSGVHQRIGNVSVVR